MIFWDLCNRFCHLAMAIDTYVVMHVNLWLCSTQHCMGSFKLIKIMVWCIYSFSVCESYFISKHFNNSALEKRQCFVTYTVDWYCQWNVWLILYNSDLSCFHRLRSVYLQILILVKHDGQPCFTLLLLKGIFYSFA